VEDTHARSLRIIRNNVAQRSQARNPDAPRCRPETTRCYAKGDGATFDPSVNRLNR